MLTKLKTKDAKGFTIIEVMIVLAIAALILLIVLLAVPALKRNSANTTIKNDVGTVAGGISTYESDNNGSTPDTFSGTGTIAIKNNGLGTTENVSVNGSTTVYAVGGANTFSTADKVGADVSSDATALTSTVYVDPGYGCVASGTAVSAHTKTTRAVALYYLIESNGGKTLVCTQA